MRTFLITAAAAATAAVLAATPAAAQYRQQVYNGYDQQYNNGYQSDYNGYDQYQDNGYDQYRNNGYDQYRNNGYNRSVADPGRWAQQLGQLHNDIERLAQQGRLTGREVSQLRYDMRVVDNALRQYSRTGINQRRAYDMDRRVRNMRIAISRSANDRDTRYNNYR